MVPQVSVMALKDVGLEGIGMPMRKFGVDLTIRRP